MFFSAHIGNWEICPLILSARGLKVTSIYRHANNPINEKNYSMVKKRYFHILLKVHRELKHYLRFYVIMNTLQY